MFLGGAAEGVWSLWSKRRVNSALPGIYPRLLDRPASSLVTVNV